MPAIGHDNIVWNLSVYCLESIWYFHFIVISVIQCPFNVDFDIGRQNIWQNYVKTTFKLVFLCHNVSWNCLTGGCHSKGLWLPHHVERLPSWLKQTHKLLGMNMVQCPSKNLFWRFLSKSKPTSEPMFDYQTPRDPPILFDPNLTRLACLLSFASLS